MAKLERSEANATAATNATATEADAEAGLERQAGTGDGNGTAALGDVVAKNATAEAAAGAADDAPVVRGGGGPPNTNTTGAANATALIGNATTTGNATGAAPAVGDAPEGEPEGLPAQRRPQPKGAGSVQKILDLQRQAARRAEDDRLLAMDEPEPKTKKPAEPQGRRAGEDPLEANLAAKPREGSGDGPQRKEKFPSKLRASKTRFNPRAHARTVRKEMRKAEELAATPLEDIEDLEMRAREAQWRLEDAMHGRMTEVPTHCLRKGTSDPCFKQWYRSFGDAERRLARPERR